MVCAPVRSIISSLKPGDYLSVQAHKPCSIFHLFFNKFLITLFFFFGGGGEGGASLSGNANRKSQKLFPIEKNGGKHEVVPIYLEYRYYVRF